MDLTSSVSVLVELLGVKYQGKLFSPFETHPVATGVAICSLLLGFLLVRDANRAAPSSDRGPSRRGASHLLINLIGLIAVASLAWLLLHDSSHSVLLFLMSLLASWILLCRLLQKLRLWSYRQIALMIIWAARVLPWFGGRAEPPVPHPVVHLRSTLQV